MRLANASFEYRDFDKVIEVLDQWILKISDHDLEVTARTLLGVAKHVTGDVKGARTEFGTLLKLEPEYQLDPFKIPPQVIETFESVRRELKPLLDEILKQRGRAPRVEKPKGDPVLVAVPTRAEMFIPGGFPQYSMNEPELGTVFLLTQLLGVAASVAGYIWGESILCMKIGTSETVCPSEINSARLLWGTGLSVFVISYTASMAWGNLDLESYRDAQVTAAKASDPSKIGLTFQLRF